MSTMDSFLSFSLQSLSRVELRVNDGWGFSEDLEIEVVFQSVVRGLSFFYFRLLSISLTQALVED